MSNPNKIHYPRGYTSVAGITFNPKIVIAAILTIFSLYAVYKYGQFAAEKNFNMATSTGSSRGKATVELLAWQPRVFYHHNFLSDSEVANFQAGYANTTGTGIKPFSSHAEWFDSVFKRVARYTQEPISNFEQGFFSKYEIDKNTDARRDWFKEEETELKGNRGNRVATVILFLSSGAGEIAFKKANLKVTPKLGDALLIWNLTPDHKIDELAVYGIQDVKKVPMVTYTIYIRERG